MMKYLISVLLLMFYLVSQTIGQVYTNKVVGKKNKGLKDSIMAKPYPYSLPIWGAKAAAKGYDLPYSAGSSSCAVCSTGSDYKRISEKDK